MSWESPGYHSSSGVQRQGCASRLVATVFSLVFTLLILGVSLGVTFYFSDPGLQGKVEMWRWDGKAPYTCNSTQNLTIEDHTFKSKKSSAIVATGVCQIKLINCRISGKTAIVAADNAKVTVIGGQLRGKTAVKASGNARITIVDAKVKGKIKTSGNATVDRDTE